MRLFAYIAHDSKERHARHGCKADATAPALDAERDWPVCQDCIKNVRDELRRASGPHHSDPVRCENCAAWVLPGNPCGTCGGIAV
jgi:hypothetical protein